MSSSYLGMNNPMCQYTRKHNCRKPEYEVTRNGKTRIYCDEAIEQAVSNGGVVYVVRCIEKDGLGIRKDAAYHTTTMDSEMKNRS
jgi:hypothetical protein